MSDQSLYFPPTTEEGIWEPLTPEDAGWNREAIDRTIAWCAEENSQQLVILHRGRLLIEEYWRGAQRNAPLDIASGQKSVVSIVIGTLAARGVLDLEAPMSTWLGEGWTRTSPSEERLILLRHLLTMTTGLYDDFERETAPGESWYYNNNAYHQTRKAIEAVTGRSGQEVFEELLFHPTGMRHSTWRERPAMLDPQGWILRGLHTTARDMARFGLLVLARGYWEEKDLIGAPHYLPAALSPSQEHNPSYGYLWWRLSEARAIVPGPPRDGSIDPRKQFGGRTVTHALAPSAPAGTVAAMGAGDMRLYVVPSHGAVIVRLGGPAGKMTAAGGGFDEEFWSRLVPALPAL